MYRCSDGGALVGHRYNRPGPDNSALAPHMQPFPTVAGARHDQLCMEERARPHASVPCFVVPWALESMDASASEIRSIRLRRRIGAVRAFGPLSYRWLANGPWPVGQLDTPVPTRPWAPRRDNQWQCPKQTGRAWPVDSERQTIGCRRDQRPDPAPKMAS